MWRKKNCYPGTWPNRFRDAWERLLQLNKTKRFTMDQDAVMVPVGSWAAKRLSRLGQTDVVRSPSRGGSGFGKRVANWIDRKMVYPTNVVHLATETKNRRHSAAFPAALPAWFVSLVTCAGDMVLDPFMEVGTTIQGARRMNRRAIGIEIRPEDVALAKEEIAKERWGAEEKRGRGQPMMS